MLKKLYSILLSNSSMHNHHNPWNIIIITLRTTPLGISTTEREARTRMGSSLDAREKFHEILPLLCTLYPVLTSIPPSDDLLLLSCYAIFCLCLHPCDSLCRINTFSLELVVDKWYWCHTSLGSCGGTIKKIARYSASNSTLYRFETCLTKIISVQSLANSTL